MLCRGRWHLPVGSFNAVPLWVWGNYYAESSGRPPSVGAFASLFYFGIITSVGVANDWLSESFLVTERSNSVGLKYQLG